MPRLSDLPKTLRTLLGQPSGNPVTLVAERFLQLFRDHGIEAAQIPRLIPELKLDDLQSPQRLLTALTPDLLDQTAKLFGIRIEWLEGRDEEIYPYLSTYKHPRTLLDHLTSIGARRDGHIDCPLRILTTTMDLDAGDPRQQLLAPLLIEAITELGEEQTVYRYHIYRDGFDWGYVPTRIELKAIAYLVFHRLGTNVPLFEISRQAMDAVLAGKIIPSQLFRTCLLTTPSLEDFVLTHEESKVAKETEELPAMLRYLAETGLDTYHFTAPAPIDDTPPAPIATPEPVPTGKRKMRQANWQQIETAALTLWAQDAALPIAQVVRQLQMIPEIKARALQPDTIRKRIAQLAPAGIRGKPGRKPKQSG